MSRSDAVGGQPLSAYAMCGLAFSGKSSAASMIAEQLAIDIISLDAINDARGLDGGTGLPVEEWERTSHIAMERLGARLDRGLSSVVDDTFSHRFLRDRCRHVAERQGARFVLLYMATPLDLIEQRRRRNELQPTRPQIQDAVFAAHWNGFQHPAADEAPIVIRSKADLAAWLAIETTRKADRDGLA